MLVQLPFHNISKYFIRIYHHRLERKQEEEESESELEAIAMEENQTETIKDETNAIVDNRVGTGGDHQNNRSKQQEDVVQNYHLITRASEAFERFFSTFVYGI